MSIEYRISDCLQESNTNRIICHIVNTWGKFNAGFALEVSKKYPIVQEKYFKWFETRNNGYSIYKDLGMIQTIDINENLIFINMLAQDGLKRMGNLVPLRYEALEKCLLKVSQYTEGLDYEIWMPKIGSGLAGGDWTIIEEIINRVLKEREVIVWEL